MKKIFLLFAAVCAFVACDPVHEDISNGNHITADELIAKSSVTVDKSADGKNGNIVTCSTSAPVTAKWNIGGKEMVGNFASKKMRTGDWTVTLIGLCADGTEVTADFPINCEVETDPIKKVWIYGEDPVREPAFWLDCTNDGNEGRFSDNEGRHLPYLKGDVYFGLKTLVFEIVDSEEGSFRWGPGDGLTARIMNGWWSNVYYDDMPITLPYWELPLTETIAKECAATDDGGEGRDLSILMTHGKIKIKSVYYEI